METKITLKITIYFNGSFKVLIALPTDRGYAWVIVFASFMINFVIDGIIYSFGRTMAELSTELNTPITRISVIGSLQQGLFYLMGPITSAFLNRFGFKIVVFTGAILTCVGILGASFVSSYMELLLYYGLLGNINIFTENKLLNSGKF